MRLFERSIVAELAQHLRAGRRFIHVVVGPRQVGKSTAAGQLIDRLGWPAHYASADAPLPPGPEWIETHWQAALAKAAAAGRPALLVLDEVQKVRGWSEVVKRLWDAGTRQDLRLHVLLLGSSALLLQHGL